MNRRRRWPSWRKRGIVAAIAGEAPEVAAADTDAIAGEEGREEAAPPATPPPTVATMDLELASALLVPGAALSYVLADQRRPRRIQWHLLDEQPGDVVAWLGLHDEYQA